MADYKVIMTLAIAGHGYDEIVAAAGCSRREVAAVKKTIAAYGFTAGQVGSMTPAEIAGLFPDGRKRVSEDYAQPDFGPVLAAMKRSGISPFSRRRASTSLPNQEVEARSMDIRSTALCSPSMPG